MPSRPSTPVAQMLDQTVTAITPSSQLKKMPRDLDLEVGEPIGKGAEGVVCKAKITVQSQSGKPVYYYAAAKKTSKTDSESQKEIEYIQIITDNLMSSAVSGVANFIGHIQGYDCFTFGICTLADCQQDIANLFLTNQFALHQNLILNYLDFAIRALKTLSSKKLVHCDVKPQNIVFNYHQEDDMPSGLILIDFGCVTNVGHISCKSTPLYIPPEIADNANVTENTDIFSFGCVLEELFTKENTHKKKAAMDLIVERKNSHQLAKANSKKIVISDSEDFYEILSVLIQSMKNPNENERCDLAGLEKTYSKLRSKINYDLNVVKEFYFKKSQLAPVKDLSPDDSLAFLNSNAASNTARSNPTPQAPLNPNAKNLYFFRETPSPQPVSSPVVRRAGQLSFN